MFTVISYILTKSASDARRAVRPDGSEDIVLATDQPVWWWWDTRPAGSSSGYPFTLVQLRLNRDGFGEGKLSLTGKLTADKDTGVMLAEFGAQPVLLTDVQRDKGARQSY